jgi:hypothetical protein
MNLYTLLLIGVTFLVLLGIAGFFFLLNWFDKRIDKKNRMGQSAYKKKKNPKIKP